MHSLSSCICQYDHINSKWFKRWSDLIGVPNYPEGGVPRAYRKLWEWAGILEVFRQRGKLQQGMKGIGFAVGTEPLACIIANHGVEVLASDLGAGEQVEGWASDNQHAATLDAIYRPNIIDRQKFNDLVSFKPVDMAHLEDLPSAEYDFAWSSCAFEHIGNLEDGLSFVINAMRLLKPGGIAVHTTEINLSSNENTIFDGHMCIYRKHDIENLDRRLRLIRCGIENMNWDAGCHEHDLNYDSPPYFETGRPHVKLELGGFITTSCMIVVRKGG
ncbi:methyltransferase family protein [Novosphingobium sp. PhB165]|uniref:methyltransferase domain-containing protein n=1 Tax=Novosphingobium sp. PhB165 TaxID=2485105 RepID=UPI001046E790|nr:methyltransferase domain-containing protein [Novosphingobium sp. PhB165]TCM18705.1 methyltransferase family protein [Novosphingobium sp. PhB165]